MHKFLTFALNGFAIFPLAQLDLLSAILRGVASSFSPTLYTGNYLHPRKGALFGALYVCPWPLGAPVPITPNCVMWKGEYFHKEFKECFPYSTHGFVLHSFCQFLESNALYFSFRTFLKMCGGGLGSGIVSMSAIHLLFRSFCSLM